MAAVRWSGGARLRGATLKRAIPVPACVPARWVSFEIDVRAPPDLVLRALTDLDALREWFAVDGGSVDARAGGAVRLGWGPAGDGFANEMRATFEKAALEGVVLADVTATSPERGAMGPTRISIELKKRSHNTRVVLREEGFGEGPAWDGVYTDAQGAWPSALLALKEWAEARAPA